MVGAEIARRRRLLGLNQTEFAERCGLNERTIAGYESKKFPSVRYEQAEKLITALRCRREDLMANPPDLSDRKTVQVVVMLSPATHERLARMAERERVPDLGVWCATIIDRWIETSQAETLPTAHITKGRGRL